MPAGKPRCSCIQYLLVCRQYLSEVTLLQIVCPDKMARGAGHMLCWSDETQAQCVPTGSPVYPCCVHHSGGEANAVLPSGQLCMQTVTCSPFTRSICSMSNQHESLGGYMHDTVVQIALVGLKMNRDGNGNLEMTHINLEHFRIPSDDVMMTTTTCTPEGRIFFGGNDGHLYEVEYRNRNSWLKGRCNKASHTK